MPPGCAARDSLPAARPAQAQQSSRSRAATSCAAAGLLFHLLAALAALPASRCSAHGGAVTGRMSCGVCIPAGCMQASCQLAERTSWHEPLPGGGGPGKGCAPSRRLQHWAVNGGFRRRSGRCRAGGARGDRQQPRQAEGEAAHLTKGRPLLVGRVAVGLAESPAAAQPLSRRGGSWAGPSVGGASSPPTSLTWG